MATNTKSETHGALTIKYSDDYPLTEPQRAKLLTSFHLAPRVLQSAIGRLDRLAGMAPPLASELGEATFKTLRWHFKLAPLAGDPAQQGRVNAAAWTQWSADTRHVKRNLEVILLGLSTPVAIADAHASTVAAEKPKAEQLLYAKYGATLGQMPAEQRMAVFTLMMGGAKELAEKSAEQTAGYVQPKKAKVRAMAAAGELERRNAKDGSVPIAPEEKGSIHINFATLLAQPQFQSLHVARTIIHEASHKFCDTRDFAYSFQPDYATMTRPQALANADSHAYAAVCLYKDVFFSDAQQMLDAGKTMNLND